MTPEPTLLTTAEAAKRLHVNAATIRRWADAGHLPVAWRTPGGRRRFRVADVESLRGAERVAS